MDDPDLSFSLDTLHQNLPKAQPCLKYTPGPKLFRNTHSCYGLTCIIFFKLKLNSSFDIFYWLLEPLIFFKTEFKRKKKIVTKNI